ncbi:TetR/AcrR family transcriptional regulator [Branchiibius cervicis]|uniref:TetR/AcrR family transcriptional regulator n=1 Tax=Branchiibius cervicis TaxID=908252 RepID=A0ABW2AWN0_9MICO
MKSTIRDASAIPGHLSPKGRRTRERILNSALELFAKAGSNSVSLRAIAAHAGLSHPAILRYFANKDELVLAAIEMRDDTQLIDIRSTDRSHEAVTEVFRAVVELMTVNFESPGIVATYVKVSAEATDAEHPGHEYFTQRYETVVEAATSAFRLAFRQNPPPYPVTAASAARQLIALMDGLQIQWLLDPAGTDVARVLSDFLGSLGIDITR